MSQEDLTSMNFQDLMKDPRTQKLREWVRAQIDLHMKFGMKPSKVLINPHDEFGKRFGSIEGLRTEPDYTVPRERYIVI